jgi:hypothetical protein
VFKGGDVDYTKLANRTLNLITKFGTGCTLQYYSPGTYNVVEGSYSSSTYNDLAVNAVFDSPTGTAGRQGLTGDALNTILSQKVDSIAYVPASGITTPPTVADRIKRSGEVYEILYCEATKPASIALLFTLVLRKG